MKTTLLGALVAVAFLAACGERDDAPGPTPGAALVLPDEFLGEWDFVGTSGGLDGEGLPEPRGERPRIYITADGKLQRHGPDGQVITQRFTVKKGKTIFAAEDQWMLVFEPGGMELVVQVAPDGTLGMSENVYDGYSSSYRRAP